MVVFLLLPPDKVASILKDKSYFSILSLNCQSIHAKFDQLYLFLQQLKINNFEFSAICLQETWLGEDTDASIYQIPNYSCISQGKRCSEHGGLIIYLHKNYNFEILKIKQSNIFEALFIKIFNNEDNKNVFSGNLYRPPKYSTNEMIQNFIDEISEILTELCKSNSTLVLSVNFNIDLLKVKEKLLFRNYLESLASLGFFPTLTLPTRITEGSATLIDQVFTNNDKKDFHLSGIIFSNISDHFPYFYCINTLNEYKKHIKFIYSKNNNKKNIDNIYSEVVKTDIMHLLDPDPNRDPNFNYNILEQIITSSVNKHMPIKKFKFNKHKHKKSNWITRGIIKSIKFRDNLFNRLKQMQQNSNAYINTKQNLVTYNKILT